MSGALIAPTARARFVVTLPPEPSRISEQLRAVAGASYTTLTATNDAFVHLARRAKQRLVILSPYMDAAGATWAAELFENTQADARILVMRGVDQLGACGRAGERVRAGATQILDYAFLTNDEAGREVLETFHAKIVLADGVAAYVGSANFLYRSREMNLECGVLLEGDAVAPVGVLVAAVLAMFDPN
ncbi:MAG: phospholipase D-like domain-containing protein [Hyphomonadaceae bacterium]|nr:phospholipase D-like domain-containing protein [Hyphomonadaceae bacterium]